MGNNEQNSTQKWDGGQTPVSQDEPLNFTPAHRTSARLVRRAIQGDPDAVEQVINLHYQDILYFAMKKVGAQNGEDVAQHAIIHIIDDLEKLQDPTKFKSWMMSLVYHDCIDYLREMRKNGNLVVSGTEGTEAFEQIPDESIEQSPEKTIVAAEDRQAVLAILDTMPENYADCIRLRYYDGMSNPEIAEVLGVDEKKVRNDMHRSHTLLRKRLGELKGKTFAAAPLGAILASEKAELVTPDAAARVLDAVQAELATKFGTAATTTTTSTTTTTQAAPAAAKTGISAAKIAGITGAAAAVVAVATTVALTLPPAQAPATPDPQPQTTQAPTPAEAPINTIADMIGADEAANLAAFEAGTADPQQWQAFLDRIGAQEALAGYELDTTYRLYALEKQGKQLLIAEKENTAVGTRNVLTQFGYIQELPMMMEVMLMFP